MPLRLFLVLIISPLLFLSCSENKGLESFEGHWYAIGHDQIGYTEWKISKDNVVNITTHSPYAIDTYRLIKRDTQYVLMPDDSVHKEVLGSIVKRSKDTVEFSGGTFRRSLKMIRLKGSTDSPFNNEEFSDLLANSILKFGLPTSGFETTIYLSDSTNRRGYQLADLIQTSPWSSGEVGNSWGLKNFKGNYIFFYLITEFELASIMINKVTHNYFTGTFFAFGEEAPVTIKRLDYPLDQDFESIKNILTETDWETKNTSLFEYERNQENMVRMEWASSYINNTIHVDSVQNNPVTFDFKKDKTLQAYKYGKRAVKYNWKISKDGKYVFIYSRSDTFAKLSTLKDNPAQLTLELGFEVGSPEEGVVSERVVFELQAR